MSGTTLGKRVGAIVRSRDVQNLTWGKRFRVACASWFRIAGPIFIGVLTPSLIRSQLPPVSTSEFELASVKPSPPGRATRDAGGLSVRYRGNRLIAVNAGLKDLVVSAFLMQYWQISGG